MSNWKPGDILNYRWGGFSNDSCPVIVVSVDPWLCAEIFESPEGSYVPDSPDRNLSRITSLGPQATTAAARVLIRLEFYEEAADLLGNYAEHLEAELETTLEGAQQVNRAQVAHINRCHAEINKLKAENEKLTQRIEELTK